MNLQPRLLGKIVKHRDLKPGDLYLSEDASGTRLILVIPNGGTDVSGLLLNEWGSSSPSPYYPKMLLHLHANQGYHGTVRLLDGEITVEPTGATALDALGKHNWEHNNGTLCAAPDGEPAIFVKWDQFQSFYKLATGESIKLAEWPYIIRKHWKLVWRDGNDALTLCEFKGASAKSQD